MVATESPGLPCAFNAAVTFEDPSGRSWPADKAAIAEIFESSRRHVKCAVLNTCFSAEQARLIGQHVEYAIGMKSSVADDAALSMAKGFYGALAATGRVSSAIQAARANLHLTSSGQADLYCASRVPEFRGFVEGTFNPMKRDPAPCDQLARMERFVTEDITMPIPPGSQREATRSDAPSTDERSELIASFVVPDPLGEIFAFYEHWVEYDGWFIEDAFKDDTLFHWYKLIVIKGMYRASFNWIQNSDEDVVLHIRLWRYSYLYTGHIR